MKAMHIVKCAVLLGMLAAVGAAFASEHVYVGNRRSFVDGSITVVDADSWNSVGLIPSVGDDPYGMVANPSGTRIYVANGDSNNVAIIDTATNQVVGSIAVGRHPVWIQMSPDGRRLYVTNYYDGNVSVIDTADNSLVVQIPIGFQPGALETNPSGSRLYAAVEPYVVVIDTATNTEITRINVGPQPGEMAYSAITDKLYVTNGNANSVTIIDALTNSVLSTFPALGRPYAITSNRVGDKVWFASLNNRHLSVIDTATDAVVNTVDLCNVPWFIALNAAETQAYVTCGSDSTLAVVDTQSLQVLATVSGFDNPRPLVVSTASPATQISSLIAYLESLNLQQGGTTNSLTSKLQNAMVDIDTGNANSCNLLAAFVNQVQALSGKKLTAAQASNLVAGANQIRSAEGCH